MEMYDLTAMGELLIDFTQLSTDGEGYPTLAAHPGGAPGNFLAALCRYGASAAFLGKVGDPFSQGGGRRLRPPAGGHPGPGGH